MKDVPSAEFRKTYPRLTEPVAVTALGRVIGHYVPVGSAIDDRFVAGLRPGEPPMTVPKMPEVWNGMPWCTACRDYHALGEHFTGMTPTERDTIRKRR